jgi:hypothetical protein
MWHYTSTTFTFLHLRLHGAYVSRGTILPLPSWAVSNISRPARSQSRHWPTSRRTRINNVVIFHFKFAIKLWWVNKRKYQWIKTECLNTTDSEANYTIRMLLLSKYGLPMFLSQILCVYSVAPSVTSFVHQAFGNIYPFLSLLIAIYTGAIQIRAPLLCVVVEITVILVRECIWWCSFLFKIELELHVRVIYSSNLLSSRIFIYLLKSSFT